MDPIQVGQTYRRRDGAVVTVTGLQTEHRAGSSYYVQYTYADGRPFNPIRDAVWGDGEFAGRRTASNSSESPCDFVELIQLEYVPEQLDLF